MKTYLGIGIGPGIGYATAERFAREGYRVVLASRDSSRGSFLANMLKEHGYEATAHTVDAANPLELTALINSVQGKYEGIDVLHYNAAILRQASLLEQPTLTFNSDLAINIGGALAASQAVWPGMKSRGNGSILITGGGFGLAPNPDYLSVSLGKAGTRALALGLFETGRKDGIHVATVTVATMVEPASRESAGIAQAFWDLHSQPAGKWTAETVYDGVS